MPPLSRRHTRRNIARLLLAAGTFLLIGRAGTRLLAASPRAQEQAPNRRQFDILAKNYSFSPSRIEVVHDDVVTLALQSEDQAHSFTIDEYRIARRIPEGGSTKLEFRADRAGTFDFYCNLSTDPGCKTMRGTLVVRAK